MLYPMLFQPSHASRRELYASPPIGSSETVIMCDKSIPDDFYKSHLPLIRDSSPWLAWEDWNSTGYNISLYLNHFILCLSKMLDTRGGY